MLKLVLLNIVCIVNRNDVQSMDKKIIIIKLLKREYLTPDVLANMHIVHKKAFLRNVTNQIFQLIFYLFLNELRV